MKITKQNAIASVQSSVSSIFSKEDVINLINMIEGGRVITVAEIQRAIDNVVDSLENVISVQKKTIDNIPNLIIDEKIKVHTEYDNYISGKNRSEQLMELHMLVKDNIKKLEK